ncbi:MAG TPA: nicotinate phosphoribosyltransferase [Candidatus Binatia bacterium]|nr:nicotinate phosphoribosyltransferase [Candidatus Sulfotelmatobacter sp.]HXJ88637.1 nicotinate phosphoribosyltransferase [Candidatus Binatia bacterium]
MIINLAERAHNHNWELDPVIRSLLDTDFYKLLMLQFIWKHFPNTHVEWSLVNRHPSVRIADIIHIEEFKVQLQHVRGLHFRKSELVWLAGNTFYGRRGIFEPAFLEWLEKDFRLSDYQFRVRDGQIQLTFEGPWTATTMWELYALAILDELKTRAQLKTLSEFGLDILYARAKTKLWNKIERLRGVPELSVADFGTRRRHSFLWQEYVVVAMAANLGSSFIGTSNAFFAHKHDLEAIGTNAHEIPMVMAALAHDDAELRASQYKVLELWQQTYEGALRVMLPDTFGTTQFLAEAPDWVADWTGQRVDSKDPYIAGDEFIEWLTARGRDPREKLLIASDTLDIDMILGLHAYFAGKIAKGVAPTDFRTAADFDDRSKWSADRRIRFSAGWGTLLTNDFRGCNPNDGAGFDPIGLICKVSSVEGRPAVKLSDNYSKALGPREEIERYRRVFGTAGIANAPLVA